MAPPSNKLTPDATVVLLYIKRAVTIVHLPVPKINSPGVADTISRDFTVLRYGA